MIFSIINEILNIIRRILTVVKLPISIDSRCEAIYRLSRPNHHGDRLDSRSFNIV